MDIENSALSPNVQLFVMQDGELRGTFLNGKWQPKADIDRRAVAFELFGLLSVLMAPEPTAKWTGGFGMHDDIDGGSA